MQVMRMLVEGGCCCHPFTVTAMGVRANDRYHLHTHALNVGGAAKGFEPKLDHARGRTRPVEWRKCHLMP